MTNSNKKLSEIIKESSELLGTTEKDSGLLLGKNVRYKELSLERLSIESYFKICDFCLLSELEIMYCYKRGLHLRRICLAISKGEYRHKKTKEVKRAYRAYRRQQWKSKGRMYGFRLRWQSRINRLLGVDIKIPSSSEIFPFFLRKTFYELQKSLNLFIHVVKNGSYESFCYYSTEFEPKEKCYSDYYRDLYHKRKPAKSSN